MAKNYSSSESVYRKMFYDTTFIEINGKKMKMSDYKKMIADKKKDANKSNHRKRQKTVIHLLPGYINKIVKHIKVMKSLAAYYDNGYRQWGVIAKEIINHPYIKSDFVRYRIAAREMADILGDIDYIGKRNEKNVYQFIEKLSYKIDDMRTQIYALTRSVWDSRVCEFFKDKECINGTGRRLGLEVLMHKSLLSMNEIDNLINELKDIAKEGVDTFDYNHENGNYLHCAF